MATVSIEKIAKEMLAADTAARQRGASLREDTWAEVAARHPKVSGDDWAKVGAAFLGAASPSGKAPASAVSVFKLVCIHREQLPAVKAAATAAYESADRKANPTLRLSAMIHTGLRLIGDGKAATAEAIASHHAGKAAEAAAKAANPVEQRAALLRRWKALVSDARSEGWQIGDGVEPTIEQITFVGKPEPKPETPPATPVAGPDFEAAVQAAVKVALASLMTK